MMPQTLIALLLMQKIFFFFKRFCAKATPTVMAIGRAGGTAMVITSSAFTKISPAEMPFRTCKLEIPTTPVIRHWLRQRLGEAIYHGAKIWKLLIPESALSLLTNFSVV